MPTPELADLLRFRKDAGRARLADLIHLLPYVDDERSANLRVRIEKQDSQLVAQADGEVGWRELEESAGDTGRLIEEVLALVMTGLLREQGLDAGVFDVAEALLAHLTSLAAVPAIALGRTQDMESIDRTRGTVALRFPGARVWELPVLCHEFGHHVTAHLKHIEPELNKIRPLERLVPAKGPERDRRHVEELLADAVATICAGPTYPLACLCLRVPDASGANRTTDTHPSWRDRVALMREVLDALSARSGKPRYRTLRRTQVDPVAGALLGEVPAADARLADLADQAVQTIDKHCPALVYAGADSAIEIEKSLTRRSAVPSGVMPLAVLDGAWRWRLKHPGDDPNSVAALVVAYCRAWIPGGRS